MFSKLRRTSRGGARLPRRSAETRRGQIGVSLKLRGRLVPVSRIAERKRINPTIAATIRSRCERSQRANANTATPRIAAHATVVPNPSSSDPPNASSRFASTSPAMRASKSSISGTAIAASSTDAPTKYGALRQLGADAGVCVRAAAASQQSRKPCSATTPATTAAIAPISPREAWLETSS